MQLQEELYRSRRAVSSTISRELFRNFLEFILAKTVRVLCPYLEECHWPLCIGEIYHPIGGKSLFGPRDPRRIRRGNIKVRPGICLVPSVFGKWKTRLQAIVSRNETWVPSAKSIIAPVALQSARPRLGTRQPGD